MVICKKCNVKINTAVSKCPLCQNELEKDETFGNFNSNIFPYVESIKSNGLWQKILVVVFFVVVVICTAVDILLNRTITWSIYPNAVVVCLGASIAIGLEKKRSLSSILFYEYIFLCFAIYYWDRITGMHNWSLNYILPILSVVFVIANFVLRLVFRREYIRYFRNIVLGSIVGILSLVLYAKGVISLIAPSFVSCVLGGLAMISIIIFDGKKVFVELSRRLHI